MRILILVTILIMVFPTMSLVFADPLPSWVKNLAYFYSKGEISDSDFARAIQYLETQQGSSLNLGGYSNATEMTFEYSNSTQVISNYTSGAFSVMPSENMTLYTDKVGYKLGGFIEIYGNLMPKNGGVLIEIIGPDNTVERKVSTAEDTNGDYHASIESDGFFWKSGNYTVMAQSGSLTQNKTIALD